MEVAQPMAPGTGGFDDADLINDGFEADMTMDPSAAGAMDNGELMMDQGDASMMMTEQDAMEEPEMVTDSSKPKTPIVHGTYDKPEEEEEVMVKTEFVWADGADTDVKLSGSWNGWMPIQMYHEGGGMWSVVTPVPAGTHEFKFIVDGEWKHSTRHPTVGDDEETMNNIRVIRGPPKNQQQQAQAAEGSKKQEKNKQGGCCVIS